MDQVTTLVPHKVEAVWYDDGNLIIIAGFKVFRVYQGVLTKSSTIFRDMLSIPQPDTSASQNQVDQRVIDDLAIDCTGSAVVRLTDKPQEVEWFLSAFFNDSVHSAQFPTNRSTLVCILRLATKYEVNFLRKWAVDCLEKLHPPMMEEIKDGSELLCTPWRLRVKGSESIDGMFPLVDVAMSVGVPWIVPHALWLLQAHGLETILHHPEWDEFPDERKKGFLLTRDAAQKMELDLCEYMVCLHNNHDMATPEARQCDQSHKQTLLVMFNRHVSRSADRVFWNNYALPWQCLGCRSQYHDLQRRLLMDQFLDLERLNGLPKLVEMLELREKFCKEVVPDRKFAIYGPIETIVDSC